MPQATREGADLGVVGLDGLDKVAAGHGDAVFGAFKLGLQGQEVLVGLQVRVALGHHHQTAEGAAQAILGLLELLEFLGIVEGAGIHLDRRGLGPRFDHGSEGVLFMGSVALDHFHQVGDQVGAALVLVLHLAPGGFGLFVQGGNGVDAATAQHRADQ